MVRKGFFSFDREKAPTLEVDAQRQFQLRSVLIDNYCAKNVMIIHRYYESCK